MKNWKLIINFGEKDEETIYFDRLTHKKADIITDTKSYVLLAYENYLACYMAVDYRLTEDKKKLFNSNPKKYCY